MQCCLALVWIAIYICFFVLNIRYGKLAPCLLLLT